MKHCRFDLEFDPEWEKLEPGDSFDIRFTGQEYVVFPRYEGGGHGFDDHLDVKVFCGKFYTVISKRQDPDVPGCFLFTVLGPGTPLVELIL